MIHYRDKAKKEGSNSFATIVVVVPAMIAAIYRTKLSRSAMIDQLESLIFFFETEFKTKATCVWGVPGLVRFETKAL